MPPLLKPALVQVMRLLGESNVIIAPLLLGKIVIGTINVTAKWLSSDDIPVVAALADHIAIALGHVRARSELESSLHVLQLRSQIALAASGALELPVVLERIVDTAVAEIGVEAGAIGLLNEPRTQLTFPYTIGIPDRYMEQVNLAHGNIPIVLAGGRPLMINEYQRSPLATEAGLESGLQAVLGAPLIAEGNTIGILAVLSFSNTFQFTQRHVEMIQSIALIASTVVQNANLYTQARRRADEFAGSNPNGAGDLVFARYRYSPAGDRPASQHPAAGGWKPHPPDRSR